MIILFMIIIIFSDDDDDDNFVFDDYEENYEDNCLFDGNFSLSSSLQ